MLPKRNAMYISKLMMKIAFIDLENTKQEINKKLYNMSQPFTRIVSWDKTFIWHMYVYVYKSYSKRKSSNMCMNINSKETSRTTGYGITCIYKCFYVYVKKTIVNELLNVPSVASTNMLSAFNNNIFLSLEHKTSL